MATIKKGTYRWNDELTDLGYTTEISIPFTVPSYVEIDDASVDAINSEITNNNIDVPLLEYGITTSFVCNSIRFYKNGSSGYYIVEHGIESYTYSSDHPALNLILGESREKISEVYHSGSYGVVSGFNNGYLRYLTVLEDTVVEDEVFAAWFNNNTKMLIKAGTYKWNDNIILPEADSGFGDGIISIPFTLSVSSFGYDYKCSCSAVLLYLNDLKFTIESMSPSPPAEYGVTFPFSPWVYSATSGWYTADYGESIKTITVIKDTYVDDNEGAWFIANTESLPAVEITYKGEKIELSTGDVATLHIGGKKLTEDLVIKVNGIAVPETPKLPNVAEITS